MLASFTNKAEYFARKLSFNSTIDVSAESLTRLLQSPELFLCYIISKPDPTCAPERAGVLPNLYKKCPIFLAFLVGNNFV